MTNFKGFYDEASVTKVTSRMFMQNILLRSSLDYCHPAAINNPSLLVIPNGPPCVIILLLVLTSGIIMVCLTPAEGIRKETSSVLMIRLSRIGARKQPYYRVVVIEKERARNGRPVEIVGTYNPRTNPASVELKRQRIDYWISKGAQMSSRVSKIMSQPAPAAAAAS